MNILWISVFELAKAKKNFRNQKATEVTFYVHSANDSGGM